MTGKKGKLLNETVINGNRVFVEDGKVKVVLREDIRRSGEMSIEEAHQLTIAKIMKMYDLRDEELQNKGQSNP